MAAVNYGSRPFREQVAAFRRRVPVGTEAWTDLWEGQHAAAFVVAGAVKEELLVDFQNAIGKAIEEGTTLAEFRRDFDQIVERHGWQYKGGRGWRTRVIYETNLRTSYQAGRYQQMQAATETRPYWRYRHSFASEEPREQHLAWDGLVLPHDDPFWDTHYPTNGWGCECFVETLSERDLQRLGKDGPDQSPPIRHREVTVGTRGPSPRTVSVPEGIDPGFGYNVGEAAWGRQMSEQAMAEWRRSQNQWEKVSAGTADSLGRPDRIPLDEPQAGLGPRARSPAEMERMLRDTFGSEEKIFTTPGGQRINMNARTLAEHINDLGRSEFIPLIPEAIEGAFEEWHSFERHTGSGKVVLRTRLIKAFNIGRGRSMLVVANAHGGQFEGWTFVPTSDLRYVNNQRRGRLIYGR